MWWGLLFQATRLYCYVHKVPVCGECICFPEHQICVVNLLFLLLSLVLLTFIVILLWDGLDSLLTTQSCYTVYSILYLKLVFIVLAFSYGALIICM